MIHRIFLLIIQPHENTIQLEKTIAREANILDILMKKGDSSCENGAEALRGKWVQKYNKVQMLLLK